MKFRADIQGLRALAVLFVIFHHTFPDILSGGYFGVDIFFVISGFIITQVLLRDRAKPMSRFLIDFYARRVRRIFPSALLIILLASLGTYLLLGPITGSDTARDGIFASLFLANWHFNSISIDYFGSGLPSPILQHYWSLAVEEQFYLLWPIMLFYALRFKYLACIMVIAISVLSFLLALSEIKSGSGTAFFYTHTRIWELGFGAAIALLGLIWSSKLGSYLGLTALILLAFLFDSNSNFPGFSALLVVTLSSLVLISSENNKVLKSRIMVYLGDISYLLYLIHWPVLQIHKMYSGEASSLLGNFVLLSKVLLLSILVHKYFENPIRFASSLTSNSRRTLTAGLLGLSSTLIILSFLRSIP